ncbi:MAG: hypothetical protein IJ075_04975 [Lachnospiraceae bacterium]|nr:hypothetical protein [Lachnospiraceae bacterium]MBQ9606529.1 hypothetical protein [Lachnospiraceae bacterium]MBR1522943.1 hypothetical protein [Lachnospiraceae bacterium]
MTLNEKARDLKSSGYALTGCGGIGLIIMVLIFTGVIPLNLSGAVGIVSKLVMSILFLVFLITGIMSLKKSKIVSQDAERENDKKNEIKKWFLESFTSDDLTELIDQELEENDLYFERTSLIKDKICERFMDVEDALMSELTEEIYTELFESVG